MMGQHSAQTDEESLQKTGRRRRNCLDVFLVTSIIFLFLAVAAVAAVVGMIVMNPQSRSPEFPMRQRTTDEPHFKGQNFVYLDAIQCGLKTSTMRWTSIEYAEGTSVGSNFVFNKHQNTLMPQRAGTYFMYINVNLTCTHKCSAGILKVKVDDKLTCEIELPVVADSRTVTRQCWAVQKFDRKSLLAQMTVPEEALENWKLDLGSGWGMFLVD